MASLIALALYAIILLSYLIISLFIIYHLANYAINSELKVIMLTVFVVSATILLTINAAYFFSINWNSLFQRMFL